MRSHISFVSFPHHPHVNPTLPIASVLVRRGHRVSYVSSRKFEMRLRALGVEFIECPGFDSRELFGSTENGDLSSNPVLRLASRTLPQILEVYKEDRPDLIIYDFMAYAGRILAHRLSVPAVQTSPTFAHCRKQWLQQVADPEFRQVLIENARISDGFLQQHGVPSSDFLFHREGLNIYLFPEVFQPRGDFFGETVFYAGRCAAEQPYYGDWQLGSKGNRPVILVSTSTTYVQGPAFFKMCLDALSSLKCRVLLSIGETGDKRALEPLPESCETVQHVSHVKILPHVDVLICLPGIITASEAAYHGVPLVVTSLGFLEEELEGNVFERLGIAVHLKNAEMNADSLRRAVKRALSDSGLIDRVKQIQRCVKSEPGAEETANRIEEYLESSTKIR